jgi:hypothetical protein
MAHEARDHGPGSGIKDDGGIRQHKGMAMTGRVPGESDNFGVSEYPGRRKIDHPEGPPDAKILSDSERSGPPNIHMGSTHMLATAHSHHGPHLHPHSHHMPAPKGKRPHHV